jgi:murein L,D-transpeptidase YafK
MASFIRILVIALFAGIGGLILWSLTRPPQNGADIAIRTPTTPIPPLDRIPPFPSLPLDQRLAAKGLSRGMPVHIRIMKESSDLELWMKRGDVWVLLSHYPICRWSGDLGPKLKEGDHQSPEGFYVITRRAMNPNSNYHLSFNLNFPNAFDKAHGRTGSFLMVHGECASVGCYAMTNPGIEDIYGLVDAALKNGQTGIPVHVFPFRMTDANLARHRDSQWLPFWRNLKQGWDAFEGNGAPPVAHVCGRSYGFTERGNLEGCQRIQGM